MKNNKIESYYEDYWSNKIERFESNLNHASSKRISPITTLLPSEKKLGNVLDVGCGDGTILFLLKHYFEFKPYGVDISENAVKMAKKRNINAKTSDVTEKIPFPDDFFDVIICSEVLEHLFFPEKALQEIYRVAKEGAVIIFSIPNITYLQNRIQFILGNNIFSDPQFQVKEHIRFWTKDSFFELLEKESFKIRDSIGMQGHTFLNKIFKRDEIFSRYLFIKSMK